MSGYVYAIGIEATTYIKIGRSVLPKVRMAALQTSMPFKLESLYSLEVDHPARVERALHEMLEGSRVRGQWFEMPEIPLPDLFAEGIRQGLALPIEPEIDEASLGERVRRAIGYRHRMQKEVAKALGISENSLTKIVTGVTPFPRASLIRDLARELNVSGEYLLGLSDVIEPRQSNGREARKE